MADYWITDWMTRCAMFAPLRPVGAQLPAIGWPDIDVLNALAERNASVVNAQGLRVRFVTQGPGSPGSQEGFEPRAFLRGEVQVRPRNWHDLFNALAWMTFPTAKAVVNARHCELLSTEQGGNRHATRDALTLFDEEGVAVLSSDDALLELVRGFRWKDLFWQRREQVAQRMRFIVFGHALYHKALEPFVGMTGKAVLLRVSDGFMRAHLNSQIAETDRLLAAYLWDRNRMRKGRELSPLPVLGVPGWWSPNEREAFYENAGYFRAGRRLPPAQAHANCSSA